MLRGFRALLQSTCLLSVCHFSAHCLLVFAPFFLFLLALQWPIKHAIAGIAPIYRLHPLPPLLGKRTLPSQLQAWPPGSLPTSRRPSLSLRWFVRCNPHWLHPRYTHGVLGVCEYIHDRCSRSRCSGLGFALLVRAERCRGTSPSRRPNFINATR